MLSGFRLKERFVVWDGVFTVTEHDCTTDGLTHARTSTLLRRMACFSEEWAFLSILRQFYSV